MDNKLKLIADTFGRERVKFNERISYHTALKVGGPAKLFFVATTPKDIEQITKTARELKIPFLIFGSGSKIMISDFGFEGVVVKNRSKNIQVVGVKGKVSKGGVGVDEAFLEIDSGVSVSSLTQFLNSQGLLSDDIQNIPGTLGGNLFISKDLQNKVKTIKVINQYSENEEIEAKDLSLRKHIVLSAVLKFKSRPNK